MNNLILVTDWEKVEKDDFYLTSDLEENENKKRIKNAKELQKEERLYIAYIVKATSYAIYKQMDADKVFIDGDDNVILHCETATIDNDHGHRIEFNY